MQEYQEATNEIQDRSLTANDLHGTKCLVCEDRASGFHYSVFSCEGCKGFFKRTVQKALTYVCREQGNCVINKFTRNSCQHCRYNKCVAQGMRKEAVREDRSPGGKHRLKRPRLEEIPGTLDAKDEIYDSMIETLVNAQPDIFPKSESRFLSKVLFQQKRLNIRGLGYYNDKLICYYIIENFGGNIGVNDLMQYGYLELKFIIEWAKKVPGFQEMSMDDQMCLLKSAFMELNVLRLAYRSMNLDRCIKFAEGVVIPTDVAQGMGWGRELVNATIEFTSRLRELKIDRTEFAILNALVLTFPDAIGIQDKLQVLGLQTKILDALRRYTSRNYPTETRRYGKILLRLPALRTVSAKAAEKFLSLTLDGSIQLNDLVFEMIT
ncbi:hypothetical protein LOTGIDRAFT_104793 [Lottia gigantea]|uniref:Uncharacterized protein n=1 Tax=Lottia gigantea TaxID=225164 RepID=V4AAQ0_LOTGI|nr:hypothetical protein LOTGIDRAFT_104793 [Lottia gigantea]ESO93837.1 hypothetical protein LOTGIDRAFT_104793 [Lottia gigantea]